MTLFLHRAAVLPFIIILTIVVALAFLPFLLAVRIGAKASPPLTVGMAWGYLTDPWVFLWPRAGEA